MAPTASYLYPRSAATIIIYDEAHQALSARKTGLGYRLGDEVQARLAEAVPLAGALRFEMLSEGRKMPTGARSFHKAGRRDRAGRDGSRERGARRAAGARSMPCRNSGGLAATQGL